MGDVRHLGVWGVLALVLSTGACTCSSDGTGTGGGAGGGSGGGGGGGATLREDCLLDSEVPTAALLEAAYLDVVENAREGVSEAPLTPKGCMYVQRTVTGGKVTALSLMRHLGYEGALLTLDGGFENVTVAPLARWTVDLNGTTLGELDDNGDTMIDTETVEVVNAGGLLQSFSRRHYEVAPFTTPVLTDSFAITRVSADRLSLRQERVTTGGTEVVRAFEYPQVQHACTFGTGPDVDVNCMPGDKAEVTKRSAEGLAKGVACLKSRSESMAMGLEAVGKAFMRGYTLGCYTGGETEAKVDTGAYESGGQIQLFVNRALLAVDGNGVNCDPDRIGRTLTHEFLHLVVGGHDLYDDIAKIDALSNDNSDPLRACEALCFNAAPTKCNCAVCLGVKACDPRCASLNSCLSRPSDGGVATMSEAIGAECRNPVYLGDGLGQPAGTWHRTMMECRSMCSYGSAQCTSKSVSCDPTCN